MMNLRLNVLLTALLAVFSLTLGASEIPTKRTYFSDSRNLDFSIAMRPRESVIMLFCDVDGANQRLSSWIKLEGSESTNGYDAKIELNLGEVTSTRYQVELPELAEDTPEALRKQYAAEIAKINDNFKRAEYFLKFDLKASQDTEFRGGYARNAGEQTLAEVTPGKIGKVSMDTTAGLLVVEILLVTDAPASRKLQIIKGDTRLIEKLLKEKKLFESRSPSTLTLIKH